MSRVRITPSPFVTVGACCYRRPSAFPCVSMLISSFPPSFCLLAWLCSNFPFLNYMTIESLQVLPASPHAFLETLSPSPLGWSQISLLCFFDMCSAAILNHSHRGQGNHTLFNLFPFFRRFFQLPPPFGGFCRYSPYNPDKVYTSITRTFS